MGVFRQLGDPVAAAAGLCQHHEAAYAEMETAANASSFTLGYAPIANGAAIVQVQIVTTETCCIAVNAALVGESSYAVTQFEIERPLATIRTQQEDVVQMQELALFHYAAWEVLPAGTYIYYLVNRSGTTRNINGAWIKAVASDCLG